MIITQHLHDIPQGLTPVALSVDRHKLSRRRWHGVAEDGVEFSFDLVEALEHGETFYADDSKVYSIEMQPEACLLIPIQEPKKAAWMGWMVGNLHFKAAFSEEGILVQDDLAVIQMLEREHIHYHKVHQVFKPSKQGGHSHDHSHEHSHSHSHDHTGEHSHSH